MQAKQAAVLPRMTAAPAVPQPQPLPRTVQKLALTTNKDAVVSSFDGSMVINDKQAVLTAAATVYSATGGHAEMYLEFQARDGLAKTWKIDLVTDETGRVFIRQKQIQTEYQPGWLASWVYSRSIAGAMREPARYQAYLIATSSVQKVFAKVKEWEIKANAAKLWYSVTLGSVRSLFSPSGTQYVNCADFAHAVFEAAGLGHVVSADVLSRPISIAARDERSRDEKYHDVAITIGHTT